MRKINHYLGAIAVAGLSLGFAACSSEDIVGPDDPNNTDVERTLYVNVAIHGDAAGSRAANDNNGTPTDPDDFAGAADGTSESTVKSVYLVFYDQTGNVVGSVTQLENPKFGNVVDNTTIEQQMQQVVPVTLANGQADPYQVICYINPNNPSDLQNPLSEVQTRERTGVVNLDGTFPMSNSVYYDSNVDNGGNASVSATATPTIGVQIPAGALFTTREEAEASLKTDASADAKNKIINIYVERYAAKIAMTGANDNDIEPYVTATKTFTYNATTGAVTSTGSPITLYFKVDAWALNGEATTTYAIKSFRERATTGSIMPDNMNYGLLDSRINAESATIDDNGSIITNGALSGANAWSWNNPTYHRSYWGCSPVYFQSKYPENLTEYNEMIAENPNSVKQAFYSQDQIVNRTNAQGQNVAWKADGTYHYVKETTAGYPALLSKNPNAAVASAVLVGHYEVSVNNGTAQVAPTFYSYLRNETGHPSIYFDEAQNGDDEDLTSTVAGVLSMKERFLWQTSVLYKADPTSSTGYAILTPGNEADKKLMARLTQVVQPSKDVLTTTGADGEIHETKLAARAYTLQLVDNPDLSTGKVYINVNGTPMELTTAATVGEGQISVTDANRILWQNVGTCNKYDGGNGFFNIPVKHYGWYRAGNPQLKSDQIDFRKVRLGDLGVVRNHQYTINVSKITGLAHGMASTTDPIIPPADTREVFMAYSINILKWAVVPTQNVELK